MFQRKSDVVALKQGEVASQESKAPTFLSSKWNNLMKTWRMTLKKWMASSQCPQGIIESNLQGKLKPSNQ